MTAATAAWAVLMTVPIVLVTYVLPKVDAWLDQRKAEREVTRAAEQLCRDHAARRNAEPSSGGLFAIPNPEEDQPS